MTMEIAEHDLHSPLYKRYHSQAVMEKLQPVCNCLPIQPGGHFPDLHWEAQLSLRCQLSAAVRNIGHSSVRNTEVITQHLQLVLQEITFHANKTFLCLRKWAE